MIDGVFTSTCYGNGQEYWRLAPNVQNWQIGPITGWVVIMNKDTWDGLSEEHRTAIQAEMDELEKEALYNFYSHVRTAVDEMTAEGVEYWTAPASEVDRVTAGEFAGASYQQFYDRAEELGFDGKAYVKKAFEALGKAPREGS